MAVLQALAQSMLAGEERERSRGPLSPENGRILAWVLAKAIYS